jgi:protein TonB
MTRIRISQFVLVLLLASVLHAGLLIGMPYLFDHPATAPEETMSLTFAAIPPPAPVPLAPPPQAPPSAPVRVVKPTPQEFEKGQLEKPSDPTELMDESMPEGMTDGVPGAFDDVDFSEIGNVISSQFTLPAPEFPVEKLPQPDPIPPPPPPPKRQRVEVEVEEAKLVHQVEASYPPIARKARVKGAVLLRITVNKTGEVRKVDVIRGHPLLIPAAIAAVQQWRYTPMLVNNQPVEFVREVLVDFRLQNP